VGTTYENITVKGPWQGAVAKFVRALGSKAFVSPTVGNITAVYQASSYHIEVTDSGVSARLEEGYIEDLAKRLSRRFRCPAFYACVFDDDFLRYELYRSGDIADTYISDSWYDRPAEKKEFPHLFPWPPQGGDASLLCTTFGVPTAAEAVDCVLKHVEHGNFNEITPWSGQVRHRHLIHALQLPIIGSCVGYGLIAHALQNNITLPGAGDLSQFIKTD
jgi:hypothetical protein